MRGDIQNGEIVDNLNGEKFNGYLVFITANHGKDELLAENAELRGRMESVQREMEVLRESVKKGEKDKQQELENSAVKLR